MAEFPALPLFTDAITADCPHLDDALFGAYTRLLILTWRTPGCRLPNDPVWIAKRLCIPLEIYDQRHALIIKEFYSSTGNWLYQKRLSKEFEYLQRKSKTNSGNAKSRWNKEKLSCDDEKSRTSEDSNPKNGQRGVPDNTLKNKESAPPFRNAPNPTPPNPIKEGEDSLRSSSPNAGARKGQGKMDLFTLPDWLPSKEWKAYLEMRVKIRKPAIPTVLEWAINTLTRLRDSGQDPAAVLMQSVIHGWPGLYPIREERKDGKRSGITAAGVADIISRN